MLRLSKRALPFLVIVAMVSVAAQTNSAIAKLDRLQAQMQKASESKDWRSYAENARELEKFLNGYPDARIEVARGLVHTGDLDGASREVKQLVEMGQYSDQIATSAEFEPMRKMPNFAAVEEEMKQNRTPISRASAVFDLPDPALLAEDIDYDPPTKRFLVTSVREKKIVWADASDGIRDFAKAPDDWPVLAIKIDPKRNIVWATEVALQGFVFAPQKDWGRSAVLCYDLKTGTLLQSVEGPHGSNLGDMALTPNGDAIVSDGDGGGVYRISASGKSLVRLDNGDFISPQTPVVHLDGKHILVPDYVRGIGILEIENKKVRWLAMNGKFALNGIDGMYLNGRTLIAAQNGTSPERVIAFTIDRGLNKITAESVIERATGTVGDPTHGVVVDGNFYYIANSGWDVIDDHGNMKPGAKLSPAHIMRFPLNSH